MSDVPHVAIADRRGRPQPTAVAVAPATLILAESSAVAWWGAITGTLALVIELSRFVIERIEAYREAKRARVSIRASIRAVQYATETSVEATLTNDGHAPIAHIAAHLVVKPASSVVAGSIEPLRGDAAIELFRIGDEDTLLPNLEVLFCTNTGDEAAVVLDARRRGDPLSLAVCSGRRVLQVLSDIGPSIEDRPSGDPPVSVA